jgi:hypothetical protein
MLTILYAVLAEILCLTELTKITASQTHIIIIVGMITIKRQAISNL